MPSGFSPTMRWRYLALALTIIIVAAAFAWFWVDRHEREQRIAYGQSLYLMHCAACHGANLRGQPNWKEPLPSGRMPAPPHDADGHTWHHSDRELFTITKDGPGAVVPGYESDMPAFRAALSDDAITAVLAYIRSTWPKRERDYQLDRTRDAQ